ncbi:hypothetical protein BDK51DRAFT_34555, partial [Blyttiomyces helicus]
VPALRQSEGEGVHPSRVYLSVVGHSLGGLIARYVAALLLTPFGREEGLCLDEVPLTLLTVATPHCGARRASRPGSFFGNFFPSIIDTVLRTFTGQSGRELHLSDGTLAPSASPKTDGGWINDASIPLLLRMVEPKSPFVIALQRFEPVLIAAIRHDVPVAFGSAMVTTAAPPDPPRPTPAQGGKKHEASMHVVTFSGFDNGARAREAQNEDEGDIPEDADTVRGVDSSSPTHAGRIPPPWHRLFHPYESEPREITEIASRSAQRADSTLGSHLPILSPSADPPPNFIPCTAHDSLLPTSVYNGLLLALSGVPAGVRRVAIDFDIKNPLVWFGVHPLAIGKVEGNVALFEGQRAGRQAGFFVAKVVLMDFARVVGEGEGWRLRGKV